MKKLFLLQILIACSSVLFAQQKQASAVYAVDGSGEKEVYRSHITLEAFGVDESVVYVTDGVELSLSSMRLNKTAGASTVKDNIKRNGMNAAVLADAGSTLNLYNCELTSHATNADGIAVTGMGSTVFATSPIINISRDNAAGLNVFNGAKAVLEDVTVNTASLTSPAFLAQQGGTIQVTDANGNMSGADSPIIYSSGNVDITGGRMLSYSSHIATVNGGGQISLEDVSFYGYKYYGFQLYNNGKSAENSGTGHLEIKESTIAIAEGPMFYVTNTSVNVDLEEVKFGFAKDAPLAEIVAGDWGEAGKNGGNLVLNAEEQHLEGDIVVDAISSVKVDMGSKVTYKGAINPNKQGTAVVVMDKTSKWTLAADSYLESIQFEKTVEKGIKQINSKGYNIYYNPNNPANAALAGKTYPLKGGGSLLTY